MKNYQMLSEHVFHWQDNYDIGRLSPEKAFEPDTISTRFYLHGVVIVNSNNLLQ